MKASVETITRKLTAVLTAAVIVFMAMGAQLALAYAGAVDSSCGLGRLAYGATIETNEHGIAEQVCAQPWGHSQAHRDSGSSQSESGKVQCCSTYCSPMFSLLAPAIQMLPAEKGTTWTVVDDSLSDTVLGRLKRPPRAISQSTARA